LVVYRNRHALYLSTILGYTIPDPVGRVNHLLVPFLNVLSSHTWRNWRAQIHSIYLFLPPILQRPTCLLT
jgi:hypothetical protein